MTFVEELAPHLPEWLARQRWFGGEGPRRSAPSRWRPRRSLTDAEPLLDLLVLAVSFADGGPVQHYQLLLGRRREPRGELEHVTIGRGRRAVRLRRPVGPHASPAWLLEAIRDGRTIGDVRFVARAGRGARATGLRAG